MKRQIKCEKEIILDLLTEFVRNETFGVFV